MKTTSLIATIMNWSNGSNYLGSYTTAYLGIIETSQKTTLKRHRKCHRKRPCNPNRICEVTEKVTEKVTESASKVNENRLWVIEKVIENEEKLIEKLIENTQKT